MIFERYRSIENSYRIRFLEKIQEEGLNREGMLWCVSEKVHGANFSFWCDGEEIKCAKRSGFLKNDAKFFGYQKVKAKYYDKIFQMWKAFNMSTGTKVMIVYGELFGGSYNHPSVEAVKNQSRIQKHIQYIPITDFIAYDIQIDEHFLSVNDFEHVMSMTEMNIPYLKSLLKGTLEECLSYPNDFITVVPGMYDLPPIDGNICEGVVIRPDRPMFLIDGSRVILKNKNEKFTEKDKGPKEPKKEWEWTTQGKEVWAEMVSLINKNRLKNVISHIGEIGQKDFGKLMGQMNKDVITEYLKDYPDTPAMLMDEWPIITKKIGQESANLIRAEFMNIVDGTF